MKRTVLANREEFDKEQTPTSVAIARAHYYRWLSFPDSNGAGILDVTALGGINMDTNATGTLASPRLRMGHLRMFDGEKYGPCTDPYTDYADNEALYLPTLKTVDGTVYRLPIRYLAMHIDLMKGIMITIGLGIPKRLIFPLRLSIVFPSIEFADKNTSQKIARILAANKKYGMDEQDWPTPPSWFKADEDVKPLKIRECAKCHKKNSALLQCARCRQVHYCDKACQKTHWKQHKRTCIPL
jgi:hypothetical protein